MAPEADLCLTGPQAAAHMACRKEVEKLSRALKVTLADPEVIKSINGQGHQTKGPRLKNCAPGCARNTTPGP